MRLWLFVACFFFFLGEAERWLPAGFLLAQGIQGGRRWPGTLGGRSCQPLAGLGHSLAGLPLHRVLLPSPAAFEGLVPPLLP